MIKGLIPLTIESETHELIRLIDDLSSNVQTVSNFTQDKSRQQQVVGQIDEFLDFAEEAKESVRNRYTTTVKSANRILALECVAKCWKGEIQMWIALKQGLYDNAWEHLVKAQRLARAAPRADQLGEKFSMDSRAKRLEAIEAIVFPNQVFFSPGLTAGIGICTICEERYEDCPHIKGYPYDGAFCAVRIEEIKEFDHVALVDEPADKMARAMVAGPEGDERDRMSGLPISELNPDRQVVRSMQSREQEDKEADRG